MELPVELTVTLVVGLGLACQWLAWRLGIPAIILLSGAGLAAGPGLGVIGAGPGYGELFHPLVGLAVGVILFEGGFSLHLHELRQTARGIFRLVSAGVVLSWLLGTLAGYYVAGLSLPVAVILGAILVITGPTVIGPLLRQARLQPRPASYLKWEGIINDPIGALLAILAFEFILHSGQAAPAWWAVLPGLGAALGVALVLGGGVGFLLGKTFQWGWVPEFLKAPGMLAVVLLVYAVANQAQEEAGLLATTLMGLVMGNMGLASSLELRRFKEHIVVLLVSVLFVALTAGIDTTTLTQLDARAAAFIGLVLLAVRPIAVLLATQGANIPWRERALAAWIAPRGIVTIAMAGVLGPLLVELGYPDGQVLLPLVVTVVLVTVTLHGFTIRPLARWLDLVSARQDGILIVGANPWSLELAKQLHDLEVPVTIADSSWHRLRPARLAGLETQSGELLSELGQQRLDLSGIGYLLATTDNDAYNALVCTRFAPELGRDRILQLPSSESEEREDREFSQTLRGRTAFSEEATYERMMQLHYLGWTFQRTQLTDEYTYEDFREPFPADAEVLLVVRAGGEVAFQTAEQPLEPNSGDTILAYRPAREDRVAEATEAQAPS